MASELLKSETIYTSFCSIQNDWEYSFSNNNTNNNEFWISLIQHNENEKERWYIDGGVNIDTNNDNTLQPTLTINNKNNDNIDCNIKLIPFDENKCKEKTDQYYAEITCSQKHLNHYNLIPSYNNIINKKVSINCLDVAKSSYFKRWYICSGLKHGIIDIYDIESCKIKMNCTGHSGDITQCKFFPFGDLILSGDTKGTLHIYAIADPKGKPAVSFHGHKGDISCVDFIDKGSEILSGSRDNTVRLWNCATQKQVMQFGALGLSTINQISVINDKVLITASTDGNLVFYDIKSGKQIVNIKGCNGDSVECFSMINSDNNGVILGSDIGICYLYDIRKLNENKIYCMNKIQRDESCIKKMIKYKDNELIMCNSSGSIWKWKFDMNDINIDCVKTVCDWTGNDQFGVNDVVIMNNTEKSNDKMYVATKNYEIKQYSLI